MNCAFGNWRNWETQRYKPLDDGIGFADLLDILVSRIVAQNTKLRLLLDLCDVHWDFLEFSSTLHWISVKFIDVLDF